MSDRTEFDEIRALFRPLTRGAHEALSLADDAAVIPGRPGFELVISTDVIVEGVHALPGTSPEDFAHKLAGVSLSDLAAKGAAPDGAFLNVSWPQGWTADARRAFAVGLGEVLDQYGVRLFGGDTVSTTGPFQASLTVLGWTPVGRTVKRSGARVGDLVFVTGTIGDGWLGLAAAKGEGNFDPVDREALSCRYRRPSPRFAFAPIVRDFASAAIDVSDGLLADLGHIAATSGVCLDLDLAKIPLSPAAQRWLARREDEAQSRLELSVGGDDYEIAFTAEEASSPRLARFAREVGLRLTPIGRVTAGEGVLVMLDDRRLTPKRTGWSHLSDEK